MSKRMFGTILSGTETAHTYSKNVIFVSDGDVRVLGDTTKVCLTPSDLCVGAITVVVIVESAIVHHR